MKRTMLALGLAALLATGAGAAAAGPVTIEFEGVEARGGQLLVTLTTRAEFLRGGALAKRIEAPAAGTLKVTFDEVPAGDYAVTAMHDADGDGQMKMGAYGPEEGWAFSGPALMGPPEFDKQKVTVPAEGATIKVVVVYPQG